MDFNRQEKRVPADLEQPLADAKQIAHDFRRRQDFISHIQAMHVKSGRALADPMSLSKYWRIAADFMGHENYRAQREAQKPLELSQILAQLRTSTPDLVFSTNSLRTLEGNPAQAEYLLYAQRRIARFKRLVHTLADMRPDFPISLLATELHAGYEKTGITDPRNVARAHRVIDGALLDVQAERGLRAALATVPELNIRPGTFTDNVNGIRLWADVPIGIAQPDGTRRTLLTGINVHHSIDQLNDLRNELGIPYDEADPFYISGDDEGLFARVEAHPTFASAEFADRFDPLPWAIEDHGKEAAYRLIDAVDHSGLDYLSS